MPPSSESTEAVIESMGPFIRNHLIKAHHYVEAALAGMSPMEMHKLHVSQRVGHCHHDNDHTHPSPRHYEHPDYTHPTVRHGEAIKVLIELRDQLPQGHHERPGVIRAIEVLRAESPS